MPWWWWTTYGVVAGVRERPLEGLIHRDQRDQQLHPGWSTVNGIGLPRNQSINLSRRGDTNADMSVAG